MPTPISAIVLTRNEENNLAEGLASLQWADEVLVVDSLSTDATLQIAQRQATRVIQHPFSNFAAQRNYAQEQARYDWVLFIDADERVSPELRGHIQALAQAGQLAQLNGYYLHRVQLFSGLWWPDPAKALMPAGQHARPYRAPIGHLRLFDRRLGHWQRPLHEIIRIPEPHGLINGVLYHVATSNLSLTLESFNHYTDLEAAHLYRSGRHSSLAEAMFRGLRSCVYHYTLGGYYQYGQRGLLMAIMNGYARFMDYTKLWERWRIDSGQGVWTDTDRRLLSRLDTDDGAP